MKRIDTSRAANAFQGAAGVTGHFQDTDPTGATQFDAEWCEGMQEATTETIEGLGGTLSGTESGQMWGLLQPRVDGIYAASADTGFVTTAYRRVVAASELSRATGDRSVVEASALSQASGAYSSVRSCGTSEASGSKSATECGMTQYAGDEATKVGNSKNVECVDPFTRAFGYSLVGISKTGANQNMLGYEDASTGEYRAQTIKVGGNANTRMDGATLTESDLTLGTDKTHARFVPLWSAAPLYNPDVTQQWKMVANLTGGTAPAWTPWDNGGTNTLYIPLDGVIGRKIVKVTLTCDLWTGGAETGKITAGIYRRAVGAAGAETALLAAEVEYTNASQGTKDLTPAADITTATGYVYYVKVYVATATMPAEPTRAGVSGCEVTEKLASIG